MTHQVKTDQAEAAEARLRALELDRIQRVAPVVEERQLVVASAVQVEHARRELRRPSSARTVMPAVVLVTETWVVSRVTTARHPCDMRSPAAQMSPRAYLNGAYMEAPLPIGLSAATCGVSKGNT